MKRGSTTFLRLVVLGLGVLVLGACVVTLGYLMQGVTDGYAPILVGAYLTVIPFFFALYQSIRLLDNIDHDEPFSTKSVMALRKIKYSALIISGAYALGMPYIYMVADNDDAPGVIVVGLVFVGASFVIAVAAAVFEQLVQKAVDIKAENDLTV